MITRMIATAACLCALASACSSAPNVDDGRFRVVAAFYPIAFVAEQVAGADATVTNVTPAGAEPHDLELTPGTLRTIRDADLVFYLGRGFQPALDDAVASLSTERAIDLLEGVALQKDREGTPDPHLWLDPAMMRTIADRVAGALGERVTAKQQAFRQRATDMIGKLERLNADFRQTLFGCERKELITSHDAFGYLARRYGLEQVAITGISPESEPSPRRLAEVAKIARDRGATTIFFETLVSPRVSQTIARQVGARTAVLNPIEGLTRQQERSGADYFSLMRENLAALRTALGCSA